MEYTHIIHPFEPVYNSESQILILGSLPSVKSRENQFYYGHPQNRFWKVIANVLNVPVPETIEEKISLLLENNIKFIFPQTKFEAEILPSTSPANAVWTLEKLVESWKKILVN